MSGRSYAQIRWNQNQLGLILVNQDCERFFLRAEKLQDLFTHEGNPRVIKLRDRKPGRASGYYPGQVVGYFDKNEREAVIRLYISEPYRDIVLNGDGEPESFLVVERYTYPLVEFIEFKRVIDTMVKQEGGVADLLRTAEMTPLARVDLCPA